MSSPVLRLYLTRLKNMTRLKLTIFLSLASCLAACTGSGSAVAPDQAIRRVDNCICYKSAEGQQLEPWKLAWDDAEKLRTQFSHCVCQAHIDLKSIPDPRRYVVPGTTIK